MKRIPIYYLIPIIVAIWGGSFLVTLWLKGYQSPKYLKLSDQEKIEIAVQVALWDLKVRPPNIVTRFNKEKGFNDSFIPAYPVYYKDVAHFMSENPDCCRITSDQWVEVAGKVFYKDKNGNLHYANRVLLTQPLSTLLWE